ncbi:MAG: hypothetical protein V4773_01970 [Verrucomicrobiota bacterium]
MSDEPLILYFIPSLVAVLWHDEKAKGRPLTEQEVIAIRDKCAVVALKPETAREMDEKRGYKDIDADNCWGSWVAAREGLIAYERNKKE